MTGVAGRLGLKPTASRQVARLAAAGLVATATAGRALRVELTDGGADQMRQVRGGRSDRFGEVLAEWFLRRRRAARRAGQRP